MTTGPSILISWVLWKWHFFYRGPIRLSKWEVRPSLSVTVSANPRLHNQHGDFGTDPIGWPFWFSGVQIGEESEFFRFEQQIGEEVLDLIGPMYHYDLTSSFFWPQWNFNVFITRLKGVFCCDSSNNQSFHWNKKGGTKMIILRDHIGRNL